MTGGLQAATLLRTSSYAGVVAPVANSKSRYHKIRSIIWDAEFRRVGQKCPEALAVYFYLLTCRHRATEGLFSLHKSYVVADTGVSIEAVDKAFDVLVEAAYISYDDENNVILDRRALRDYEPKGKSQITGAFNRVEEVPDCTLKGELLALAQDLTPDFAEELIKEFPFFESLSGQSGESLGTVSGGQTGARERARAKEQRARASRESQEQEHRPRSEELEQRRSHDSVSGSDLGSDSDLDSDSKISALTTSQNGLPPGWTFLEGPEQCVVCGSACLQLDPEGTVQHFSHQEGGF